MPVISALRKKRQEDHEAIQGYRVRYCLKTK
jgi:hypothetical protein